MKEILKDILLREFQYFLKNRSNLNISNSIEQLGGVIRISKAPIHMPQQVQKNHTGRIWQNRYFPQVGTFVENIQHQNTEERSMVHIYQGFMLLAI